MLSKFLRGIAGVGLIELVERPHPFTVTRTVTRSGSYSEELRIRTGSIEMNQLQIFTPILPYVGHLPGELRYGSRIKVRGHFREPENIVHIILQKEALLNPQDDLPLYITIHPGRKEIIRNHLCSDCSTGGQEERIDNCPIECGQDFELTIAPSSVGYEILLHGSALHTFSYRTPLAVVRYLFVSSGCVIFAINFENLNVTESDQPHQPSETFYNRSNDSVNRLGLAIVTNVSLFTAAPPLQTPQLYPVLEQHHKQRQTQQPRPHHHHHHHSNNNLRELVLQVLPLVQLAASQLQANANSAPARINDANTLTAGNLAHLLPLFQQPAAKGSKGRSHAKKRPSRWTFLRINNTEIVPAMFLACSMGLMRLFRFLTIACVFGYVGYVFSRNIHVSWK